MKATLSLLSEFDETTPTKVLPALKSSFEGLAWSLRPMSSWWRVTIGILFSPDSCILNTSPFILIESEILRGQTSWKFPNKLLGATAMKFLDFFSASMLLRMRYALDSSPSSRRNCLTLPTRELSYEAFAVVEYFSLLNNLVISSSVGTYWSRLSPEACYWLGSLSSLAFALETVSATPLSFFLKST